MSNQMCFQCFKVKGDYEVCPHCGHVEESQGGQACQLSPGTVLRNRYIIGICIGFGGFGITYKAYDTVLSIVVAIKEFYPAGLVNRAEGEKKVGIFSGDKQMEFERQRERFLTEAKNMATFSKEKDIVNVYDYFEENQTAYIIMEYIEGTLLKERLKQGRMDVEEAKGYMVSLLTALEKVHYHGIIHKDVSPDNIFLTGTQTIKLFDFGAAKFQGTESERSEDVVIKAGYTPPEQYRSKNEQGAFMDIYAAGAVFYEMVTGEKPMEAPDRAVEDEVKMPSEYGIEIEENLERIIMKAMAMKPEHRFQTATQFQTAIEKLERVALPEENEQRHVWRKRILGIASLTVTAALLAVIILSQTVFSGKGKLDIAGIEADTIEVWLKADTPETGDAVAETLVTGMEKSCPQITLEIETIPADTYEQRLQEALQNGDLPEVFCTDALNAKDHCEELSPLLHTMEMSDYLYLEEMLKSDIYELPTAVQAGVVYVNKSKQTEEISKFTIDTLANQIGMQYADEENAYQIFGDNEADTLYLAGDLSDMESVEEVTVHQIPPTDYAVVPVVEAQKLIGSYQNCYGVSKTAGENQKNGAMLVLSLLLSEGTQSAQYMNNEEGIPINRSVYEDYRENKMTTYLAFLKEYKPEEIVIKDGNTMCEIFRENEVEQ